VSPSFAANKKKQLQQNYDLFVNHQGKAASEAFIQSSTQQLQQWLIDLKNKKMSQGEFENLVSSQAIAAKNVVASQALAAQERG
jgi:hypothetical protein